MSTLHVHSFAWDKLYLIVQDCVYLQLFEMLKNAKIIFQLFSRSVAIGLKVYRQLKVPGFADSTGTEEFTLLINDLFDILNAKIPPAGIKKGSPKI